jgi:hypothetical protein
MKRLKDITTFGGIDADADDLLDQVFQDHKAYKEAIEHKKFLIVGRKGSGKTALFRRITTPNAATYLAHGMTFADYPWGLHKAMGSEGVPEEQRYQASWTYLILISLAHMLLNKDQSQPWDNRSQDHLSKIEKFFTDSFGSRNPDLTSLFAKGVKYRFKAHIPLWSGGSIGIDPVAANELPRFFNSVNRAMLLAISESLNPNIDYHICFDELDRNFDPDDKEYSLLIIGLIMAARDINRHMRSLKKKMSAVVFLRTDIYQTLRFEDKNKVTEGHVSAIEWDSPGSVWTLRRMMESRFGAAMGAPSPVAWNRVFDESSEMTGRQSKYQHMVDRTFLRPRDMIKFCNAVLETYAKTGSDTDMFSNSDITSSRTDYSDYLLRELQDEVHKHHPDFDAYLEVVKGMPAAKFTRSEFSAYFNTRKAILPDGILENDALRSLFDFSVVGYRRSGGVGGGSEYVWKYLDGRSQFDESADQFSLHAGLTEAMSLKKWRKN